jgi:predicted nucleic acid-binding protein
MRTRAQDAAKAVELESWADMLARTHNILTMDTACFRRWSKLMHGRPDSLYEDAMIAATALEHGLSVVTRNCKDFAGFHVPLIDPFAPQ